MLGLLLPADIRIQPYFSLAGFRNAQISRIGRFAIECDAKTPGLSLSNGAGLQPSMEDGKQSVTCLKNHCFLRQHPSLTIRSDSVEESQAIRYIMAVIGS